MGGEDKRENRMSAGVKRQEAAPQGEKKGPVVADRALEVLGEDA